MLDDGLGPSWKLWRRQRYIVALLASLGFFNTYAMRTSLSVAIVAMTTVKHIVLSNGTTTEEQEFHWDSKMKGLLLSSFFYGYIVTQIPSALLASRIGGSKVFGIGILVSAILGIITPPLASISVYLLFTVRVLKGFFQGVIFPSMHEVWAKWAPPMERSRLVMIAFTGTHLGTVVTMTLSGVLAEYLGWSFIFYIFGILGVLWFIAWIIIVKEGPEKDPFITPQELKYIRESRDYVPSRKFIFPPWKELLSSTPVWAIVVAHFCSGWYFYTLLTQLPSFLKEFLELDIKHVGFMSAIPYAVMASLLPVGGFAADYLRVKGLLTTTQVRKLFSCGCFIIQSFCLFIITLLNHPGFVITCLMVSKCAAAISWSGFNVNHLDIAPQYAGILMGLTNTFATIPGIISPVVTGYIIHEKNPKEWRYVFYISSTILLIGALFYGTFASGEIQSWAKQEPPVVEEPAAKEITTPSVEEEAVNSTTLPPKEKSAV